MDVGRTGIWSIELRTAEPGMIQDAAAELDAMGWDALWIPGLGGGDILGDSERLLSATTNTAVAVGVLSIWRHPAAEMAAGHAALRQRYGPRLMLGLGVSDQAAAQNAGSTYRPLSNMGGYLDELDAAPAPAPADERLMAALGPKMVQLAAARTAGVHPFLVTPEYSAATRTLLGPGPLLAPYQAVVVDRHPSTARSAARQFLGTFLQMDHYARNIMRQGFTEEDIVDGGSDRLIDSLVGLGKRRNHRQPDPCPSPGRSRPRLPPCDRGRLPHATAAVAGTRAPDSLRPSSCRSLRGACSPPYEKTPSL